ncbi:MAG: DEAD/DEAH box helicase family protein [Reyranella sp.]|nr:DEAD/DEAH box helicase family protein [Reyranella sp.]
MTRPEDKAREEIDRQLVRAGWVVQDRESFDLGAGLGISIRYFPLIGGECDYILMVDRRACGVLEAKKAGVTLSGVAEQSEKYIVQAPAWVPSWGPSLRFHYESTGEETNFRDTADPDARSRRVHTFHRPETLHYWLRDSGGTLRARLRTLPPLRTEGLRPGQIEAIEGLERSLARGDMRALQQAVTGAGKTFTACTFGYRLLAHAGARRILFLVDRNNLGRQALTEFQGFRPPGTGRLFTELYGAQRLGPSGLDKDAQVVISTIQRVFSQITGEPLDEAEEEASGFEHGYTPPTRTLDYNPHIPPETFDVIVVDETHRSIFGTWRQVFDYFDAFVVGLTATPTPATLAFFRQNLVSEYPYERSVADGVNVPFEIYRIRTRIGEQGSRVGVGFTLPRRDRKTRRQRYAELTDELVYAPEDLDRSVVAPNQIRAVLQAYRDSLPADLFPGRTEVPKTLIFAKDDNHAEEIVVAVREVFGKGNDFAKKITYRVTGIDPEDLIAQFRSERYPRIAVTVDMIATGTDVKAIEVVIFMRDVRSDTYFEQMKGRGMRAIQQADLRSVSPDADRKERFILIDAVGVTESRKTMSAPLERRRTVPFVKLLDQVALGKTDEDTVATLAGRLAALNGVIDPGDRSRLREASGGRDLSEIVGELFRALDDDVIEAEAVRLYGPPATGEKVDRAATALRQQAARVFDRPAFRRMLVEVKELSEVTIDDVSADEVLGAAYDPQRAQETVDRFRRFLDEKKDELLALQILYGQPYARRRLTYAALADLRDALARPPWLLEPPQIWQAYRRLSSDRVGGQPARVLTDIVSLVRFALGRTDTLQPFGSDVAGRFNLWIGREKRAGREYDAERMTWLTAIRDHIAYNAEATLGDLQNAPAFADRGGVVAARRLFGARLPEMLDDLGETLVA